MELPSNTLQLKIEGLSGRTSSISVRSFVRAAEALEQLLSQMAADLQPATKVDWIVSNVKMGSVDVDVGGRARNRNQSGVVPVLLQQTLAVVEVFESESPLPSWVTYGVAEKLRALSTVTSRGQISLSGFQRSVQLSRRTATRAKDLIDRRYVSFGSVEGTIETISVRESPPYFTLFHILDDYAVKCKCSPQLLEVAHQAFNHRVRVMGRIERRFDGRVDSIELESIQTIPPRSELPQPRDIRGILAKDSTTSGVG